MNPYQIMQSLSQMGVRTKLKSGVKDIIVAIELVDRDIVVALTVHNDYKIFHNDGIAISTRQRILEDLKEYLL